VVIIATHQLRTTQLRTTFLGVDTTGLEQMICFQLYAASRAMTSLYRPFLDAHKLTYPQYIALRVLWNRGPITVRDLGQTLQLDSGTLSPLLKRLEAQGHIRRERGTADERTVLLHVTDSGCRLRDQLGDLPERVGCDTGLTAADYEYLRDLMRRIHSPVPAVPGSNPSVPAASGSNPSVPAVPDSNPAGPARPGKRPATSASPTTVSPASGPDAPAVSPASGLHAPAAFPASGFDTSAASPRAGDAPENQPTRGSAGGVSGSQTTPGNIARATTA
jgi:MarR family transcriptional regulator, organic hydroperoxide resistance regulator